MNTIRYKIDSIAVTASSSCVVCNGLATAWVSGGFVPYTFMWSNGATTQSVSGLCAGNYTLVVVDSNADTIKGTCFIGPQSPSAIDSVKSTCINTGIAAVYASGGTPQYTYLWNNGATTSQITGITAGTYSVTITDSNGCQFIDTAIVPQGLHYTISNVNVICNADSSGSAWVSNITDGTSPYTYAWAPNAGTNDTANGLLAGQYTVTITDNNGCFSVDSVNITQPPPIVTVYDTVADTGSCSGKAMIYISGGFTPYSFSWLPNVTNMADTAGADTALNLCHGVYFFCVTDAHGCSVCDSVYIRNAKLNAVNEIAGNKFEIQISPNPASNMLNVSLKGAEGLYNLEVDDMFGRCIMQQKQLSLQKTTLNVSTLPAGVYMLRFNNLNRYSIKSFIINH